MAKGNTLLMKKIGKFFKSIDTFGEPILLSYRGKIQYKTFLGGFLSLLIMVTIFSISLKATIFYLITENIKITHSEVYQANPSRIELRANEDLNLAFSFSPELITTSGKEYFKVRVLQKTKERLSNGTRETNTEEISVDNCSKEKAFSDLKDVGRSLCLGDKSVLQVEGNYFNDYFSYIKINIEQCVNSTNVTCASPEEIKEVMESKKIYFNLIYANTKINTINYENSVQNYTESRRILIAPGSYYKQVDFHLQNNIVDKDDSNLLIFDRKIINVISVNEEKEQIGAINSNCLASIFLKSSPNIGNYLVSSEKFSLLLARLGGFFTVLYSIVQIFARFFNRKKMLISLANTVYNFSSTPQTKIDDEEEKDVELSDSQQIKSDVAQVEILSLDSLSNIISPGQKAIDIVMPELQFQCLRPDKKLISNIKAHLSNFKKIKINFMKLVKIPFLFLLRRSSEKQSEEILLIKKGLKKINHDIDLLQILQKLKEIDKLKNFLFEGDQRILFEFFPKPLITLGSGALLEKNFFKAKKSNIPRSPTFNNFYIKKLMNKSGINWVDDGAHYLELYKSYENIKRSGTSVKANNKLIKFLEGPVKKIFDNHISQKLKPKLL